MGHLSVQRLSESLMSIREEASASMTDAQRMKFANVIQMTMLHGKGIPSTQDINTVEDMLYKLSPMSMTGYFSQEAIVDWDQWFFQVAKTVAMKSKVPYGKTGCVIVGLEHEIRATGYNGFPRGADDYRTEWYEEPDKYKRLLSAEANAVATASYTGTSLRAGIAYSTSLPDAMGAGLLVNAGIKSFNFVVPLETKPEQIHPTHTEQFVTALEIFKEMGVDVVPVSDEWDEDGDDPKEREVRNWVYAIKNSFRIEGADTSEKEKHAHKDRQQSRN